MVKRILLSALIVVCVLSIAGCSCDKDEEPLTDIPITIKIIGDTGVEFSGEYLVNKTDGSTRSGTVEGAAPAAYVIVGYSVSCTVQKKSADEKLLKVQILKAGEVTNEAETQAPSGVVTVESTQG